MNMKAMFFVVPFVSFWSWAATSASVPASEEEEAAIAPARPDDRGWLVHTVTSPYQAGATEIRVLLPERRDARTPCRVLYVLPVEAGDGRQWGDPQQEVLRHELHNRHGLICVYPTFSHLPWYADHPTDRTIRQESYLLHVVVPFVDRQYAAGCRPQDRWLVGFSKSGWGAFSLLLRHPDVFGRAAAWDAPLNKAQPNQYGMDGIFATQENFDRFRITTLLTQQAATFATGQRLVHLGYDNFREHHLAIEKLLAENHISHVFCDGPARRHAWDTGWLPEAVSLLSVASSSP